MFKLKKNIYIYIVVLGFELRATLSHLKSLHQPFFVKDFFTIGSCKLFAQAGFEQRTS
jgi:hypothetical protein